MTVPFEKNPYAAKLMQGFRMYIRGTKHDFPFINIRKVPREVLKSEGGEAFKTSALSLVFNSSHGTEWKIMFDPLETGFSIE